ncbi:MAG: ATP-binding protein [Chloroflexia bacterium]
MPALASPWSDTSDVPFIGLQSLPVDPLNGFLLHCFSPVKVIYSVTGCARLAAGFQPHQVASMQVYRRSFEGQLEQLAAIHDFIDQAAAEMDLGEEDAFACRLAADEAAANAFEHAYSGLPGRVEVTTWREDEAVRLDVRNWGAPFDPQAVAEPDISRPLEERPIGGLGIFLMRKFMDEVSFSFHPQEGNTITMRRRLRASPKSTRTGNPAGPID